MRTLVILVAVAFAGAVRADIDCAQCRQVCKSKSYPEELGTETPTSQPKHKSSEAEAAFTDGRRKDPAFGGRDLNGAIASYKRAVAVDPENSQYRNYLAGALMASGNVDEAIVNLDQAVKLVPSEAKYLVNLGYAHHRRGDEVRALLYYMRGLLLDPHDVRARLFSGYALEILGYDDEAVLELKKVLNQDEKNEGARRALARLGALSTTPASSTASTPGNDPAGIPPPPPVLPPH
jgi:tetratricopeptide (TPR) repeat protein